MKILYDHQAFTGNPFGGVSRYFAELMQSLDVAPGVSFELSLLFSNNDYLQGSRFSHPIRYPGLARNARVNRLASGLNRLYSLSRIRSGGFDLFHPTFYHRYFLDHLGSKPFVLTFYDATSERYPHPDFGAGLTETKHLLLRRASRVIAISEFSKQEILTFFPDINPAKIDVVPLSTTFGQEPMPVDGQVSTAPRLPFPYLLFVGKRPLYKNFTFTLDAIRPVLARHTDLRLVCAGGGAFSADEKTHIQALGLSDRVVQQPFDEATLPELYRRAEAFVFPSLNEGFGIPVLEAFACHCPAVLSNRSSLPEVGGNGALYFDPEQPESLADALERVLTDSALRVDLVRRGTEQLSLFSSQKTAQQTLAVYQNLLGRSDA